MRIALYARPWSIDLLLAVEERWRASGREFELLYVTSHVEAARLLAAAGRKATFVPHAIRELPVSDPVATLGEIEARHEGRLLPLMRCLMADRTIAGHDPAWQVDQLARHALFFDDFFGRERADAILGEASDWMPGWVAFALARAHGCASVGITPSAMPSGRLLLLRTHQTIAGAAEAYERIRAGDLDDDRLAAARALQAVILGHGTKLDYLPPVRRPVRFLASVLTGVAVRRQLHVIREQMRERRAGNWFAQPNPIGTWLLTKPHAARAVVARRRHLNRALSGRPFAFYPLQYQPEASTLVHASYFDNQLEVIRNLGRSMPGGWDLVVKEHFFMAGQRPLSFYRELERIPNVRLVAMSIPTNKLIQEAAVVTVITSTCGLEASLIGRPVVMFGEYPWDYAPTVRKVEALTELPELLRSAPERDLGRDDPDVLAFAASWDAALPEGRYYTNRRHDWLDRGNVHNIAEALWAAASESADEDRGRLQATEGSGTTG
jgi:hypothetical protein